MTLTLQELANDLKRELNANNPDSTIFSIRRYLDDFITNLENMNTELLLGPFVIPYNDLDIAGVHGTRLALIPAGTLVKHIYVMPTELFNAGSQYHLQAILYIADFSDEFVLADLDVGNGSIGGTSSPTKAIIEGHDWAVSGAGPVEAGGLAIMDCDLRLKDLTTGALQGSVTVYVSTISV